MKLHFYGDFFSISNSAKSIFLYFHLILFFFFHLAEFSCINLQAKEIKFNNLTFNNEFLYDAFFKHDFSNRDIILENCGFQNIIVQASPYLLLIVNSNLIMSYSNISNYSPSFVYGVFSDCVFNNNNFSMNNFGFFFPTYAINIEYGNSTIIKNSSFLDLQSTMDSPVI